MMASSKQNPPSRPPSPPLAFPTSGFQLLEPGIRVEEERLDWYKPQCFYPVRIGEVFHSRYQVVAKLGYGSASTAWLCRDLVEHQYVTLKVYECSSHQPKREIEIYKHLTAIGQWPLDKAALSQTHFGAQLVRPPLSYFIFSPKRKTDKRDRRRCGHTIKGFGLFSWARKPTRMAGLEAYGDGTGTSGRCESCEEAANEQEQHAEDEADDSNPDSYDYEDDSPQYTCLVYQALGMDILQYRRHFRNRMFPLTFIKCIIEHVLMALDYLHSEVGIIHCDIQQTNIILGINDQTCLRRLATSELNAPSPRKVIEPTRRVIHLTRNLDATWEPGRPILCDFGEARVLWPTPQGPPPGTEGEDAGQPEREKGWWKEGEQRKYSQAIHPVQYRAPEVLFQMDWDEKVDIWNVGVMMWDLLESRNLFAAFTPEGTPDDLQHMSEMIALMGMPPAEMVAQARSGAKFFDDKGDWKYPTTYPIPALRLEDTVGRLDGEEKDGFVAFARRMLRWRAQDRPSARELLEDGWLKKKRPRGAAAAAAAAAAAV